MIKQFSYNGFVGYRRFTSFRSKFGWMFSYSVIPYSSKYKYGHLRVLGFEFDWLIPY